jgi:hypothetical protein
MVVRCLGLAFFVATCGPLLTNRLPEHIMPKKVLGNKGLPESVGAGFIWILPQNVLGYGHIQVADAAPSNQGGEGS